MSFNVMLYVYECTNHCFGHFNDLTDDRTTLYAHSFLCALFIIEQNCYGADERRADSFARLYFRDVVTKQARFMQRANRYNTSKTKSNHRVSVGRRSANYNQQGKAER